MNFISFFKISRTALFAALTLSVGEQLTFAAEADEQKLVAANNTFTFDLMEQVAQSQPDANVFLSPFSVSSVLQMVENGAVGPTKEEMQEVLHTTGLSAASLNESFKQLNHGLVSHQDVVLNLANGIWVKQGFHLKPAFVADNKKFFEAELANVDFDSPKSAQTINHWAEKQTQGRIKDVVNYPFDPLTRVVLANAIYFKGKWVKAFDKNETRPRDFYLAGGAQKETPMMLQRGHFQYQKSPDFQAVELPYKGGLRMEVFLPATNSSPQKLIEMFKTNGVWQNDIQSGFGEREGLLILPKFKMDYATRLNEPLEDLGMKRAFDAGEADFSGMADKPLFIGEVKQKSYVDVDEEGTEAAAVTTVTMMAGAAPRPSNNFTMIVDRPFLFVILDDASGSVLFIGIVNDPSADGAN